MSVRLRRDGGCALLTVADTGRGIVEDQHGPVSEAFSQVENPGRDRGQGDGLGLAIVQRLVELIDARITLHTQAGRGTRFEMRIPGAEDAAPVAEAPRPREPVPA